MAADRRLGGTSESAGLANPSEHEILSPEPVETKSEANCSSISCAGSIPCGVVDALDTSLPETKSPYPTEMPKKGSNGDAVAIRADGDCCYHIAGVFLLLCRNPNALAHGVARCLKKDIVNARRQILFNFRDWLSTQNRGMNEEELQALSLKTTGDFIGSFMTRTSGKARGKERLGSYTDLGIFTRHEDIRVVVTCTDLILRNSSKNDDLKSVYEAVFPGESVKNRVVCAILSSGHFDIGVVLENGCTRAVFDLGSDWDCALELILTFIKSKSPESLSPRWSENSEPPEGCECGETACDCRSNA